VVLNESSSPGATSRPSNSLPPATTLASRLGELEALGITGVVGVGKSQFASYSSPNRDANVVAGGNEFDGLLVAPGELLSFNTTVGEITPEKGYEMGEMISGGVVLPSYGGGICQVSTTLFRAALWGGLPIEERHNHSWRLAWYEVDAPPGMDATIALGGPDLQIRNTTDGWLLIDVETDTINKTQTFTLYGTPRDIEVSLDGPTWDNAGGLVITRRITQHGSLIGEDSWASYYSQ
jgi:vancomycin resistance protein YoaR